jgi:hypothetical protein
MLYQNEKEKGNENEKKHIHRTHVIRSVSIL